MPPLPTDSESRLPTIALAGSVVQLLESCSYRWLFDSERQRFRRVPRSAGLDGFTGTPWQHYERFSLAEDRKAFVVTLDPGGTRLLSAEAHADGCRCAGAGPASR